ncbi:MAG: type II toxin-antitoxin system RelE/ParE family toxin [Thermoplasmata archaeon]|nr:type II toxin-antitoxin system RelE/ParE family toxin [Thermoplasmata archaeon]
MFQVLVSRTFQKQFHSLSKNLQKRIRIALKKLEEDPLKPRTNVDIKPLKDTKPQKYRLKTGNYRIIYNVENNTVKVIELFYRERGYRK